ncbi:MAG: zinc-dependent alcohol dehydrogenase [Chloroflexota bacterium]
MKAAFCLGAGKFELRDMAMPSLNSGEVMLRVEAAGICGSDKWELSQPRVNSRVAGHEISGVIEAVSGDADSYSPGMAVVLEPAVSCGQCDACRGGNFTACRRASVIGYGRPGGFAEYLAVPQQNLFPMPPSLSFAEASLAEPTAVAVHGVGLAGVTGQKCVVFSSSTIGLLVAQVLRERGAEAVWVVDINADHLQVASELDGIQIVNSAQDPELRALSNVAADV